MPTVTRAKEDSESSSEDEQEDHPCVAWSGLSRTIPVLLFVPEAVVAKDGNICSIGERYKMAFKIVRTESRLVRGILMNHGFHEVHPNSNDFNLMWTGSHLKPYLLRSLLDFQKVNHFPRSYELTRKDRLYKNIQRMQQTHGFKNFHIVPQTFVLPTEYQEFCNYFSKDKGPWIIKPVASSRGRGIYLVSNPNQISMDENILVSRYINNPLLIDEFKFDMRLYVLVTSYDPLLIYVYEEGLARFATVKYELTSKNIKNTFMHLTNYSVNKKSSDYVSCDDPEVEDYGNKWSMSAALRYLKQEGKDTTLLMRQIEDVIIKAVLSAEQQIATACKTFVPHKTNCFELYGFDVLIDSNLKPWLLEVNLSPSLACDAPLDLKIKASMIADMFSLVGFVCQDPLSRKPHSDRLTLESNSKKSQKPFSAPPVTAHSLRRQRPTSANSSETEAFRDKQGAKHSQAESTLTCTAEEIKVLRRINEEYERRGGFIRIFPTADSWERYGGYLESKTSMNLTLASRLFHGRNVSGNVQLQEDAVRGCHVVQYERKLLSLEVRKRRQHHLTHRSSAGKKKSGKHFKASPTESDSQEGEECTHGEQEALNLFEPTLHKPVPMENIHKEALSSYETLVDKTLPRVNLLNILHQGWDLSKIQARVAFSSYLWRVQHRLLAESRTSTISAWPNKDNDQMELVIRFLKRAASNLHQDIKIVLPSRKLPLQDQRRILSHQLGEFIHCYNKETEHMEKTQDDHCVNPRVFQEYITAASENDLEEVLTFYTQKNKSSNVFLGTKAKSVKKHDHGGNVSADLDKCENFKSHVAAKEDSSASESSLSTRKVTELHPSGCMFTQKQWPEVRTVPNQPDIQASQHGTNFPLTLDCTRLRLHPAASIPLHCPPPPPPPTHPPQPPSYAQSLAKSQFHLSETVCDPPAYTSTPVITQTQTGTSKTAAQTNQVFRKIQSFTSSTLSSGKPSSIPSARLIYSQKLCRPTSADKKSSTSVLKTNSMGSFKELSALAAQAQSNQQAFISVLQKLADKKAASHPVSPSRINLLTQHLTNLNLANRMLNRESFTINPKSATTQRPVRAIHSSADSLNSTGHRLSNVEETLWDTQMQNSYSLVTGVKPKQSYQPTQGSYQLQFAINQLQQQRQRSHLDLDQSLHRHQVQLPDQTCEPHTLATSKPSNHHPSSTSAHPTNGHIQTCVSSTLVPKPPSSAREKQGRKPALKRPIKQASSESRASGNVSSSQQMVYEAICGKAGLSVYHKLFQDKEPSHR
ncbi:tubulin polyglutamylase TTLL5 isoform X2 [Gouania willdenowi]|uniref:tubulin polyglutamylase TTLL5 isoform X2 n=1 Tax=Gouania willdenowi TaxID=441366 RepID=UPI0010555A25|nr:tubulin polyglutamylase TTLL5 isoform X2 [Gouania willdenowi]